MELLIEPYYHKENFIIDTENSFEDCCDYQAFIHQYYSKAGINLYSTDDNYFKEDKVATIEGIFFKYNRIYQSNVDIVDIVELVDNIDDTITDDTLNAILTLKQNGLLSDGYTEEMPLICYLNRLYIYPDFRNKGIATYIYENLQELFTYISGDLTSIIIIFPRPQEPINDTFWHNIENNTMLDKMIKMLNKNGFKTIGNEGFYFKCYNKIEE